MIASITGSITSAIGDQGLYAVFGLMVLSAVLPAASELTMLYGGAIASGAIEGAHLSLFGNRISTPAWGFIAVALAGTLGTTLGALIGWTIGYVGERQFLERHGRWLHLSPERLERAHNWFERRGSLAVPLGLALPLVRSFIAIPAGVARMPLSRFLPLAALGSAVFCFVFAGLGWALGSSWDSVHKDVRIVEYVIVGLAGAALVFLFFRWYTTKMTRRAHDPAD